MCSNEGSKKKQQRVSERSRNQGLDMRQTFAVNSSQEKWDAALLRKRKISCNKDAGLKLPYMFECKLAIDDSRSQEQSNFPKILTDDEELELSELQTGSSPPRCSAHLAS